MTIVTASRPEEIAAHVRGAAAVETMVDDLAGRDRQHQRGAGRDQQRQQRQQDQSAVRTDERRQRRERRESPRRAGAGDTAPCPLRYSRTLERQSSRESFMAISMYQASAPVFDKMLGNLGAILGKAATWAEGRKIEPAVLLGARLAPDMFPLMRQVQIACDFAKGTCARPRRRRAAEVRRQRDQPRRSAGAHRPHPPVRRHVQGPADRRLRGAADQVQGRLARARLQGTGLPDRLCAAEFLLPLHDGLRHPAAQRPRAVQARLHRLEPAIDLTGAW